MAKILTTEQLIELQQKKIMYRKKDLERYKEKDRKKPGGTATLQATALRRIAEAEAEILRLRSASGGGKVEPTERSYEPALTTALGGATSDITRPVFPQTVLAPNQDEADTVQTPSLIQRLLAWLAALFARLTGRVG